MEYTQLDFARFETRFLRLLELPSPNEASKPARFEIVIASLSSPPPYFALSYYWGDGTCTRIVEVDGNSVKVSEDLADALSYSDFEIGDHIWAGALCIDQKNLYEKSYQITRMGQIYSQAERTVVWLGAEGPCSKHAADLLFDRRIRWPAETYFHTSISGLSKTPTTFLDEDDIFSQSAANEVSFMEAVREQPFPARALQGLRELLSRPYWERVWIIQEIAKARQISVKCGSIELDLNAIFYAASKLKDTSQRTRSLLDAIINLRAQEQRGPGAFNRMTLFQAIIASRYSLAKDERDKVYALLSLTSDGSDLIPIPTYTESIDKVWLNLTTAIIRSRCQTNALLLARWVPLSHRFPKMPPWAVDWSDIAHNIPPWLTTCQYQSSAAVLDNHELVGSSLRTGCRLIATIETVEGYGHISAISPVAPLTGFEEGRVNHESLNVMRRLQSIIPERFWTGQHTETTLNSTDLTDALARMIRDADKLLPSANYNFTLVCEVLYRLGRLKISRSPVWDWAREYNHLRTMEITERGGRMSLGSVQYATAEPAPQNHLVTPPRHRITASIRPRTSLVTRTKDKKNSQAASTAGQKVSETTNTFMVSSRGLGSREKEDQSSVFDEESERPGYELLRQPTTPTLPPPPEIPPIPNPGIPHIAAFRAWEEILKSLAPPPEFPLRFAVVEEDNLVMICDGARPDDEICELDQCGLPVVLRKKRTGDYMLIGEACLGQSSAGEWKPAAGSKLVPSWMTELDSPEPRQRARKTANPAAVSPERSIITINLESRSSL